MCPNCRAFITANDRVCPYCGNPVGARAVDRRNPGAILGGLIPAEHFTTALLLLINGVFFVASYLLGESIGGANGYNVAIWALGAKLGESIWQDHQYWRLITAGFLHGDILHIAFNSWALFVLGAQVEELFAAPRLLVIYFVSTLGGFYLSARMQPGLSIGASAGIMGLIGAMVAFGISHGSSIGRQIRNHYLGWLAFNLAYGFVSHSIDNWAHIGGFAGGFGAAYLAGTPMQSTRTRDAFFRAAAAVCVLITVYCFWQVYRNFPAIEDLRALAGQ